MAHKLRGCVSGDGPLGMYLWALTAACLVLASCAHEPPAGSGANSGGPPPATRPAPALLRIDKAVTVPLARPGGLWAMKLRYAPEHDGWFLFDTGASVSYVTRRVSQQVSLKSFGQSAVTAGGGRLSTDVVMLPELVGDGFVVKPHLGLAMDLARLEEAFGLELSGVIGADVVFDVPFVLDVPRSTLTLYPPSQFRSPAGPSHRLRMNRGVPTAQVDIGGVKSWFVLDAGTDGCINAQANFGSLHRDVFDGEYAILTRVLGGSVEQEELVYSMDVMVLSHRRAKSRVTVAQDRSAASFPSVGGSVNFAHFEGCRLTVDMAGDVAWCERSPDEPLDELLNRLGPVDRKDRDGLTPLAVAADLGRADAVQAMLDRGAQVDAPSRTGATPLMGAVSCDAAAVVRLLLKKGADVNARDDAGGTALRLAAARGNEEIVAILLAFNASTQTPGRTPLHAAAMANHAGVIRQLIAAGAEVDAVDPYGMTPLGYASMADANQAIEALLAGRASIEPPKAKPPLMLAAYHGRARAVQTLLAHGAAVDQRYGDGRTALMSAAVSSPEATRVLLRAGADPTLTLNGRTAFDFAVEAKAFQCAELLRRAGKR